jgi:hypothetical protein
MTSASRPQKGGNPQVSAQSPLGDAGHEYLNVSGSRQTWLVVAASHVSPHRSVPEHPCTGKLPGVQHGAHVIVIEVAVSVVLLALKLEDAVVLLSIVEVKDIDVPV